VFHLNLHILLGLNCLMQSVAVSSARQNPAGELINNHYLSVLDNIFVILKKQGVCLQQLAYVVQALGALGKETVDCVLVGDFVGSADSFIVINGGNFSAYIGKKEKIPVLMAQFTEKLASLVCKINGSAFFINSKVEFIVNLMHPT